MVVDRTDGEEAGIIEAVLHGEVHLYRVLVMKYRAPVFNLAYRMTGSHADADDLAQEIFVRAFEKLHRFDRARSFFTWLYTIALNLIRNHLKKAGRIAFEEIGENTPVRPPDQSSDAGEILARDERITTVESTLQKLPKDLREALVLKFYQDLAFDQVAEILGISLSAAKMRVYRGLEKMRVMVEEEEEVIGSRLSVDSKRQGKTQ
jgi:RNA polymerase sigma-70 factor, ECF subfamily